MSALSIAPAFQIFTDTSGEPLEDGFIWIGAVGLDPQANPIATYWDSALTQLAAQPIRTINGYPSNNGTPATIYVNSEYSIRLADKNGSVLYSSLTPTIVISSNIISYKLSGQNTVSRTVESKLNETVSVKDFGAIGNGIVDDTLSVQAAFSYLQPGGTLYFPPGVYIVSDSISVTKNTINVRGDMATLKQTAKFKKTLNFLDAQKINITGMRFIGAGTDFSGVNPNSASYNGVAAIFLANCVDCLILDCHLENHAGGGIRFTDVDGLKITNTTIIGVGAAGGITPLANYGDAAIGVANAPTGDANVIVSNCIIKEHCFGILSSRRSGLVVTGCIVGPIPGQHGIYAAAKTRMVVTGCSFYSIVGEAIKNQIAASSDINTLDSTFSCNTFTDIDQSCIVISPASGSTLGRFNNVAVTGNTARNVGNYFAVIRRCDQAIVSSNSVFGCNAHPIELQDFQGKISDNIIKSASWSAVYLQASGPCEISNNVFQDVCLNFEGNATPNIRYSTMVYVTAESGTGTGHNIIVRDNTYRMTVLIPVQLTRCYRSSSTVDSFIDKMNNETSLPMQIDSLSYQNIGYSPNADQSVTASLNPNTPRYGRGRRELFGTQDPANASMTDTFRRGDVCWNATPSAGGAPGWMCTADGAPGTWTPMAALIDYEEGTWTPVLTCSTPGDLTVAYSTRTGLYTKIGRLVTVYANVVTSTFTHSTASGPIRFTGLPFNVTQRGVGSMAFEGITKANYTNLTPVPVVATTHLDIFASGSAQSTSTVKITEMPTAGNVAIQFTVTYTV